MAADPPRVCTRKALTSMRQQWHAHSVETPVNLSQCLEGCDPPMTMVRFAYLFALGRHKLPR